MSKFAIGNKYPINTKEQVKLAMDYFDAHLKKFSPYDRVVIASGIKKQAAALKVSADKPWIHNYSRIEKRAAAYSPEFEAAIKRRKDFMRTHGIEKVASQGLPINAEQLLDKIAEHKDEWKPVTMVQNLAEFDKLAGLDQEYDVNISDPIMSVVGSNVRPKFDGIKIAGSFTSYDLADLRCDSEAIEKIAAVFEDSTAENLREDVISAVACMSNEERSILASEYGKAGH